jgi:hypothetical protein
MDTHCDDPAPLSDDSSSKSEKDPVIIKLFLSALQCHEAEKLDCMKNA